jgi:outer membrane protein
MAIFNLVGLRRSFVRSLTMAGIPDPYRGNQKPSGGKERMKKLLTSLCAGVLVLVASGAFAADAVKIGLVNLVKVINDATEGKRANAELESFLKARQMSVDEKAANLEKAKKDLEKTSQAAAKKAKEAEVNRLAAEYQNLLTTSQAEVQKKAAELKNYVLKDIKEIVDAIGAEDKFTVVLTEEATIYFQKTIDITDRVIKKYDESKKSR